jgi:hypothetical protein
MRISMRAGAGLLCTAAFFAVSPSVAWAQAKKASGPSDQAVGMMMEYAWSQIPQKFTLPSGKVILFDKNKRSEIEVPMEVARQVVVVGYRSYEAEICGLREELLDNRNSMMEREVAKKTWNDQQLQYINFLHFTVVAYTKGQMEIRLLPEGDKEVNAADFPIEKKFEAKACSEERRKNVREAIAAYVKAGPPLATARAPAEQPTATPAAVAPVAAPAKKK